MVFMTEWEKNEQLEFLKDEWTNMKYSASSDEESGMDAVVLEAITTLSEKHGSDFTTILKYVEERYEIPDFRWSMLIDSLHTLTYQWKLLKEVNRYKIAPRDVKGAKLAEVTRLLQVQGGINWVAEEEKRQKKSEELRVLLLNSQKKSSGNVKVDSESRVTKSFY